VLMTDGHPLRNSYCDDEANLFIRHRHSCLRGLVNRFAIGGKLARPALSASRAIDVLDFFAAFPGRNFTMSEIMRATEINIASCHAILSALVERGYLERHHRSYRLGRALIAVGRAAHDTNPLVARAQDAARELRDSLGVAVLLSTLAGNEILALTSLPDPAGRNPRLRVGQRVPLVPPNGAHFVAWAAEDEIDAWIARSNTDEAEEIAGWRKALALTRRRGFQVTLRSEQTPEFSSLMAKMAQGAQALEYRAEAKTIADHGWTLDQPGEIEPSAEYEVVLIAAPIFDHDGQAILSLGLGGFDGAVAGARITEMAEELVVACLRVMRAERGV